MTPDPAKPLRLIVPDRDLDEVLRDTQTKAITRALRAVDIDHVEDIVQKVMIGVWVMIEKNPRLLSQPKEIEAIMQCVVTKSAINVYRSDKRVRGREGKLNQYYERHAPKLADAALYESEINDITERTLGRLGQRCRLIFQLRPFEDIPPADIATTLVIAVGTVNAQLQKARCALRDALEKAGYGHRSPRRRKP